MPRVARIVCVLAVVSLRAAFASPPEPPVGFRWELVDAFSDEFEGSRLDRTKWHDHNPYWKGRPPGKFMPRNVRVADGMLQLSSTVLDPPDGSYGIACGAVQTKSREGHDGYYECRVKASAIATSTTFWLTGARKEVDGGTIFLELDILECVGGATRFPAFRDHMSSNTHVNFRPSAEGRARGLGPGKAAVGDRVRLASEVSDEFHTYGCWWVDATTMHFYADGEFVFTIKPSTEFDPAPFDRPMFMNLLTETYDWQPPPSVADLNDGSRNTAYYDYVRGYRLVAE